MARTTILGLDPGSRCAGYALATIEGRRVVEVQLGSWRVSPATERASALAQLRQDSLEWISAHKPDVAVVESLFHHRNVRSALVLAQVRGVLLSVIGELSVPLFEYAPATIKQTICGNGSAGKQQVRICLERTVPGLGSGRLDKAPVDATDALAAAICHHTHHGVASAVARSARR